MPECIILDVCNFLKAKHILIPSQNSWLRGCISCFRESNRNYTPKDLKDFVFDQWKLADLNDISAPSLPNNCKTAAKLILPGKYAVQINYAVNIGESFYKQLQKIRRPAAEENLTVDTEKDTAVIQVTSNRTLKLEITDGVVTILGFEDKLISKLTEPLIPGVKAILNGPIECRKGVLFLSNQHIDLLGGEVDTFHVNNAAENVIARVLKQPENPDPFKVNITNEISNQDEGSNALDIPEEDVDAFLQIPDDIVNETACSNINSSSSFSNHASSNSNTTSSSFNLNNKFSTYTHSSPGSLASNSVLTVSSSVCSYRTPGIDTSLNQSLENSVIDLSDDDEEFALIAAETASLAEKTVKTNKTPPSVKQSSLHNFFANKETKSKASTNNTISNHFTHTKNEAKSYKSIKSESLDLRSLLEGSYSNSTDAQNELENNSYTSIFKSESQKNSLSDCSFKLDDVKNRRYSEKIVDKVNEVQSKKLPSNVLNFPPKKYPCTLTVRGSVVNISHKLSIQENKWNLSAIVRMHGVEMEVDFSSEALDKLFGMTATQLQSKRREVKENPKLKEKINEILKTSQKKIQQLDCEMKVHFSSYIAKPEILQILD